MALKLKTLKRVPPSPTISGPGEGNEVGSEPMDTGQDDYDPGEGPSSGPTAATANTLPKAEARTRHHIYNQSVVSGW